MPVFAQYTSIEWFDAWNNSLSLNVGTPLSSLRENLTGRVKFRGNLRIFEKIDVEDYYIKSDSIASESSDFSGLSIGDRCRIVWRGVHQGVDFTFEVTSVEEDIIYYTNAVGSPLDWNGVEVLHGGKDSLFVETPLVYCKYKWGLSGNDGSKNTSSRLDGSVQQFEVKDIDLIPSNGVITPVNSNDASLNITFVGNSQVPFVDSGSFNSAQDFLIEHEFTFDDLNELDYSELLNGDQLDRFLGVRVWTISPM